MPLDGTTRATAIEAARKGLSIPGIAGQCRVSRSQLYRYRMQDPSFDEALDHAMSEWESDMVARQCDALNAGDAALASTIAKLLVHRFPQRYSTDPRMRLSGQAVQEGRVEDLEAPERNATSDTSAAVIGRLVDRMLSEDATPESE